MLDVTSLNPFAIGVATLVGAALGAAWYSPVMFGEAWIRALGKPRDQLGAPGPAMLGAGIGGLLGLGIVGMTMLSDSLFSGWGWPLYLIQVGYRAIYLVLMGAICGGWPA